MDRDSQKFGILQVDTRDQNGKPSTLFHILYTLPLDTYSTNTDHQKTSHSPLCNRYVLTHTPFPQQSLPVSLCLSSFWHLSFRNKFSKMYSCILTCWIKKIILNLNTDLYCVTIKISLSLFPLLFIVIINDFRSAFFLWGLSS